MLRKKTDSMRRVGQKKQIRLLLLIKYQGKKPPTSQHYLTN